MQAPNVPDSLLSVETTRAILRRVRAALRQGVAAPLDLESRALVHDLDDARELAMLSVFTSSILSEYGPRPELPRDLRATATGRRAMAKISWRSRAT